jgi:pyruvate formate lyase activating enzyme
MPDRVEEAYTEEEFLDFLKSRSGKLGAVCVSGGEPTLYPKIVDFIRKIKGFGLLVKLDTNGTRPEVLKSLVEEGLVDYVAMDIKNSPTKYEKSACAKVDMSNVCRSVDILMEGGVDFEFRTTLMKELHDEETMEDIGRWILGSEKYFLQTYRDEGDLIEGGFTAYSREETEALLAIVKKYLPNAEIRG